MRPRGYDRENRRKKKLMAREAWYRGTSNVVGSVPPTPGGQLAAGLQRIVTEEGNKIGLNIRVTEQSGTQLSALLTTPDLSGCLYPTCDIEEQGASHSRRGANYSGTCTVCGKIYIGETGFGAHSRVSQHQADIRANAVTNSLAQHIAEEHPEHMRDPEIFSFSVNRTGPKPLERQVREAQQIVNTAPTNLINGRTEYIRPAIQRLAHADLLGDNDDRRDRQRGT